MKMSVTFYVNDEFRRALNVHYGRPGKATREEMRRHFLDVVGSGIEDIMAEFCADCDLVQNDPESGSEGCAKHVMHEDPLDPRNLGENPRDRRRFVFDDDPDKLWFAESFTHDESVDSDPAFLSWIKDAKPGDEYTTGGGAWAERTLRCIRV